MIGDHRPLRTGMPQQFRADPAVLHRNDISIAQKLGRPGGQIRQVADRPSHDIKTGIEFNNHRDSQWQRRVSNGKRAYGPRAGNSCALQQWRARCWSRAVRSEEHTSELQSLMRISYAVFCLKKLNAMHQYASSLLSSTRIILKQY